MLKGVELTGGLRDFYLSLQQQAENEIEYLKVCIQAYSAFGKAEETKECMSRIRVLLGLKPGGEEPKDEWMKDASQIEKRMGMLKGMKITIEKPGNTKS